MPKNATITYGSGTLNTWVWARVLNAGGNATLSVPSTGIHTVNLWLREDGAQIDRVLLTTRATYMPSGNGPAESPRSLNARQVLAEAAPKVLYKIHVARSTQLLTPGAGQTYRISYYAGTRLIAIREVGVRDSLQFFHTDHLGSVSAASYLAGAQSARRSARQQP